MSRSTHTVAAVAALLAAALALPACRQGGGRREKLVVAALRQPATGLLFVARNAGCLARAGVDVEERTFELGRDALALMAGNGADAAVVYETPTARAASTDPRVRVLTALHTSTRNTRLVARRDRGIGAFSQLAGARIALPRGSNTEYVLDLLLRFGGMPRTRVTVVDLAPEEAVAALAAGRVDAAVLFDPWAARAERLLGDGALVLQTELYAEFSLLLTRDDVLRTREEALRRLVRALACAEAFARDRPEEALAAIRPRFPELGDDELRAQLGRVRWGLGLDNALVGALRDEAEWMVQRGEVKGEATEPERLVDRRLLEEVLPEAVMLLPPVRGTP